MKEIIGKAKHSKKSNFPRKLKIGNKIKTGEDEIASEFDKYFADIGLSLAENIPNPSIPFESFFEKGQYYLAQSVSFNKRIERCLFFSEYKQKSWC